MDGSLDTTFGSGGEVVLATNSACPDLSQHIAVGRDPARRQDRGRDQHRDRNSGGTLTSCDMLVLRFNPNGSLDTSFGQNGQTDIHLPQGMAAANGVAVLASGQIVVAGTNPDYGYIGPEFVVARLTSSGALDTTFGPNGQGYNYTTLLRQQALTDYVDVARRGRLGKHPRRRELGDPGGLFRSNRSCATPRTA